MSNPMQRLAELEAEVSALTAERSRLLRERTPMDASDVAERVGMRLARVEQNLREDFIGKFAGNFLLATETITHRLVAVEEREKQLEERQQKLQKEFESNIERMKDALREAYACEKELLTYCHESHAGFREALLQILQAHNDSVETCNSAVEKTAHAAKMCATFADDYKATSYYAQRDMTELIDKTRSEWGNYQRDLIKTVDAAVKPALRELRRFDYEQTKRKTWLLILGLITGLVFSSGFSWLTQPNRYVRQDARDWRTLTDDLTTPQRERMLNLLSEIEREKRAVERREREEQRTSGSVPPP